MAGTQPRSYRCRRCGEVFGSFGALGSHAQRTHPKATVTALPSAVAAGIGAGAIDRATASARRRIEDLSGSPGPDRVPPAQDAIPPASHPGPDDPLNPEPTGGRLRPSRPQLSQPAIRISPEMRVESVRDAVRDALPMATLADLLHAVSVAVSEADGAGPAGYLSPIQCTQVAVLLYDSTIDLVVTRFDGNISRFKAGMAVVLILVSKGSIHARAIGAKLDASRTRSGTRPLPEPEPPQGTPSGNGHVPGVPGLPLDVPPGQVDTYAAAQARQAEMMRTVSE